MKCKKKIATLLVMLLTFSSIFSACGSGDTQDDTPQDITGGVMQNPQEDGITSREDITGHVVWGAEVKEAERDRKVLESFKKAYPNVTVDVVEMSGPTEDWLATKASTGELPSCMYLAGDLCTYAANGYLYPLDEFITEDDEDYKYNKEFSDDFIIADRQYALASNVSFYEFWINHDVLDELNLDAPEYDWTIDDFWEVTKAAATGEYTALANIRDRLPQALGCAFQKGLYSGYYNIETQQFDLTSGAFEKAMDMLVEMINTPNYDSDTYSTRGGFDAGEALAKHYGSWYYVDEYRPNMWEDFGYVDMYPLPQDPEVGYNNPAHVGYAVMFSSVKEEDKQATWELLKWMTYSVEGIVAKLEVYDNLTDAKGNPTPLFYIPPTTHPDALAKAQSSDNWRPGLTYMLEHFEESARGDCEKFVPGFAPVFTAYILPKINAILNGEVEASAVAAEAEQKANAALEEYKLLFDKKIQAVQDEFDATHSK